MIDLAVKNLLHDKIRFLITASGVAFSVLLVTVQLGIFLGLLNDADITIRKLGADLWVTSRNAKSIDFPHFFSDERVLRVRSIAGVSRADNLLISTVEMAEPTGAMDAVMIYALDNAQQWNFPWLTVRGRREDLGRGKYIMIDESGARRLGPFEVGDYREIESRRFQIIGKTQDARTFVNVPIVFMDYHRAESLLPAGLSGATACIVVKLAPGADPFTVAEEIRRRLPFNDVYTTGEWAYRSRNYWIQRTALGLDMYVTVFLGCLVGIVIVAQTLYTSTMEHSQEYGTLKAIGCSNGDIYLILIRQAVISGVAGFILGIGLTELFGIYIRSKGLHLAITPSLLILIYLGTLALCIGASMLSFRKVASIDPALVFRR